MSEEILDLPARPATDAPATERCVLDLAVKKISSDQEGGILITLEGDAIQPEPVYELNRLLQLQRTGLLRVRFEAIQSDLFGYGESQSPPTATEDDSPTKRRSSTRKAGKGAGNAGPPGDG